MKIKRIISFTLTILLCTALTACGKKELSDTNPDRAAYGIHHATITVENYGVIKLELDGNTAPITVENFVELAKSGFYDGLTVVRAQKNFVIQCGDPKFDGTGESDKKITGEFSANGIENNITHKRGVISMARSQDMNSASCQFFIVHKDSESSLDGMYAGFGHVTEGMDVVDAIAEADYPFTNSYGFISREAQPVIKSIVIDD